MPLCYLAKRAIDFDRASAYSCCVVGNCFSLQKEHDVALKFFQRAIQLQVRFPNPNPDPDPNPSPNANPNPAPNQPDLAYAYTLSGHEYSANDDFEKAMACSRYPYP